jgi:hypothetical protein
LLIGVVEEVDTEGKKVFRNFYELWDILNPRGENSEKPSGIEKKSQLSKKYIGSVIAPGAALGHVFHFSFGAGAGFSLKRPG